MSGAGLACGAWSSCFSRWPPSPTGTQCATPISGARLSRGGTPPGRVQRGQSLDGPKSSSLFPTGQRASECPAGCQRNLPGRRLPASGAWSCTASSGPGAHTTHKDDPYMSGATPSACHCLPHLWPAVELAWSHLTFDTVGDSPFCMGSPGQMHQQTTEPCALGPAPSLWFWPPCL